MQLQASVLSRLFGATPAWSIRLVQETLTVDAAARRSVFPLSELTGFSIEHHGLWRHLLVSTANTSYRLVGASQTGAESLRRRVLSVIANAGQATLAQLSEALSLADRDLTEFLLSSTYIASSDVQRRLGQLMSKRPDVERVIATLRQPLFRATVSASTISPAAVRLMDFAFGERRELRLRNERFVDDELKRRAQFFDTIESQPLTLEQRRAAIIAEDRNLTVAAAGSGKTSVIVGKVGYALLSNSCQPAEILALAFNRSAANELKERIERRLSSSMPDAAAVQALTFHKLGLEIIAQAENAKPSLAPWVNETGDNAGGIIQKLARDLTNESPSFLVQWHMFRALASKPIPDFARYASRQEYEQELERQGERDGDRVGLRTLNGELVKSREELYLANWLYLNSVTYEYERRYEFETANRERRQYFPDFYYPDIKTYHEHFALDAQGRAPTIFAADYAEGVAWKRALHAEKGTELIETTSAQFRDDTVFEGLRQQLVSRGQVLRPRSMEEVERRLSELRVPRFETLFKTFISLAKANAIKPSELSALRGDKNDFRNRLFLNVVTPLFEAYEEHLRDIRCVDFDDLIWRAVAHLREGRIPPSYKLIFVDEFQDISRSRAALVKAMLEQNIACKLFAVGDDWQSIYRFAGADQSIMANFEDEFGTTATSFLTETFRCNQGIADVSSKFVQRNPGQIRKGVRSRVDRRKSTIHVLEYSRNEEASEVLELELVALANHAEQRDVKISVLILSRFRHARPEMLNAWKQKLAKSVDLEWMTLHRAKGLEADYVFILDCTSGQYGLPSELEDDPVLHIVMPKPETFQAAEERRLFYVGLTRAKHRCHLMTRRGAVSPFIRELVDGGEEVTYRIGLGRPAPVPAKPCAGCSDGVARQVSSRNGQIMACSNSPRCRRTERTQQVAGVD